MTSVYMCVTVKAVLTANEVGSCSSMHIIILCFLFCVLMRDKRYVSILSMEILASIEIEIKICKPENCLLPSFQHTVECCEKLFIYSWND